MSVKAEDNVLFIKVTLQKKCMKRSCLILRPWWPILAHHWVHSHPNKRKTTKSWVSAGRTSSWRILKFKTTYQVFEAVFLFLSPAEHQQDLSHTEVKNAMDSLSFAVSALRSQLSVGSFMSAHAYSRTQQIVGKTAT